MDTITKGEHGDKGDKGEKGERGIKGERGKIGSLFSLGETTLSMRVVFKFCLLVMTFFVVIGWTETFYWKYWPFTPAIVYSSSNEKTPFPILKVTNPNKTVCAGSDMTYVVDIDKKMNVPYKIKRSLVDSSLIMYPVSEPPRKELGRQLVKAAIHVPRSADRSKWFMTWTVEYEIGPEGKRIIPINAVSEKFTVVDCDPPSRGLRGFTGEQGEDGDRGEQGKRGIQGLRGIPGKNRWR